MLNDAEDESECKEHVKEKEEEEKEKENEEKDKIEDNVNNIEVNGSSKKHQISNEKEVLDSDDSVIGDCEQSSKSTQLSNKNSRINLSDQILPEGFGTKTNKNDKEASVKLEEFTSKSKDEDFLRLSLEEKAVIKSNGSVCNENSDKSVNISDKTVISKSVTVQSETQDISSRIMDNTDEIVDFSESGSQENSQEESLFDSGQNETDEWVYDDDMPDVISSIEEEVVGEKTEGKTLENNCSGQAIETSQHGITIKVDPPSEEVSQQKNNQQAVRDATATQQSTSSTRQGKRRTSTPKRRERRRPVDYETDDESSVFVSEYEIIHGNKSRNQTILRCKTEISKHGRNKISIRRGRNDNVSTKNERRRSSTRNKELVQRREVVSGEQNQESDNLLVNQSVKNVPVFVQGLDKSVNDQSSDRSVHNSDRSGNNKSSNRSVHNSDRSMPNSDRSLHHKGLDRSVHNSDRSAHNKISDRSLQNSDRSMHIKSSDRSLQNSDRSMHNKSSDRSLQNSDRSMHNKILDRSVHNSDRSKSNESKHHSSQNKNDYLSPPERHNRTASDGDGDASKSDQSASLQINSSKSKSHYESHSSKSKDEPDHQNKSKSRSGSLSRDSSMNLREQRTNKGESKRQSDISKHSESENKNMSLRNRKGSGNRIGSDSEKFVDLDDSHDIFIEDDVFEDDTTEDVSINMMSPRENSEGAPSTSHGGNNLKPAKERFRETVALVGRKALIIKKMKEIGGNLNEESPNLLSQESSLPMNEDEISTDCVDASLRSNESEGRRRSLSSRRESEHSRASQSESLSSRSFADSSKQSSLKNKFRKNVAMVGKQSLAIKKMKEDLENQASLDEKTSQGDEESLNSDCLDASIKSNSLSDKTEPSRNPSFSENIRQTENRTAEDKRLGLEHLREKMREIGRRALIIRKIREAALIFNNEKKMQREAGNRQNMKRYDDVDNQSEPVAHEIFHEEISVSSDRVEGNSTSQKINVRVFRDPHSDSSEMGSAQSLSERSNPSSRSHNSSLVMNRDNRRNSGARSRASSHSDEHDIEQGPSGGNVTSTLLMCKNASLDDSESKHFLKPGNHGMSEESDRGQSEFSDMDSGIQESADETFFSGVGNNEEELFDFNNVDVIDSYGNDARSGGAKSTEAMFTTLRMQDGQNSQAYRHIEINVTDESGRPSFNEDVKERNVEEYYSKRQSESDNAYISGIEGARVKDEEYWGSEDEGDEEEELITVVENEAGVPLTDNTDNELFKIDSPSHSATKDGESRQHVIRDRSTELLIREIKICHQEMMEQINSQLSLQTEAIYNMCRLGTRMADETKISGENGRIKERSKETKSVRYRLMKNRYSSDEDEDAEKSPYNSNDDIKRDLIEMIREHDKRILDSIKDLKTLVSENCRNEGKLVRQRENPKRHIETSESSFYEQLLKGQQEIKYLMKELVNKTQPSRNAPKFVSEPRESDFNRIGMCCNRNTIHEDNIIQENISKSRNEGIFTSINDNICTSRNEHYFTNKPEKKSVRKREGKFSEGTNLFEGYIFNEEQGKRGIAASKDYSDDEYEELLPPIPVIRMPDLKPPNSLTEGIDEEMSRINKKIKQLIIEKGSLDQDMTNIVQHVHTTTILEQLPTVEQTPPDEFENLKREWVTDLGKIKSMYRDKIERKLDDKMTKKRERKDLDRFMKDYLGFGL